MSEKRTPDCVIYTKNLLNSLNENIISIRCHNSGWIFRFKSFCLVVTEKIVSNTVTSAFNFQLIKKFKQSRKIYALVVICTEHGYPIKLHSESYLFHPIKNCVIIKLCEKEFIYTYIRTHQTYNRLSCWILKSYFYLVPLL